MSFSLDYEHSFAAIFIRIFRMQIMPKTHNCSIYLSPPPPQPCRILQRMISASIKPWKCFVFAIEIECVHCVGAHNRGCVTSIATGTVIALNLLSHQKIRPNILSINHFRRLQNWSSRSESTFGIIKHLPCELKTLPLKWPAIK